ncbi:PurB-like adenylosuccinate lyase [Gordonia phage Archimedes]|uniref:PurB-like adenylosuccinate lyase n=1 Tax=Gordonia phage Archimedes TaxID=2759389 RepID=A0A7L7SKP4_9CAUD|nr:PurB-like adenylosuccinate lyase [Gordonia phage Archimedes]QOC55738.1 PurB-like adenylosuccinate lyase [Gordonia phage Archimedes]
MHPKYQYVPVSNYSGNLGIHAVYLRVLAAVALAQGYEATAKDLAGMAQLAPFQKLWDRCVADARHETAGFVQYVREALPDHAGKIYIGMTSSDLQDTAEAHIWFQVWKELRADIQKLAHKIAVAEPGQRWGRTHGRVTGEVVDIEHLYGRALRNLAEAVARIDEIPLRASLSGPVGNYSDFLTREQADRASQLLLIPLDSYSTQTADRHRYAELAFQLSQIIGVYEQLATLHRLSSVSGVDEFSEGLTDDQKGSSSMPHKVNPMSAEQVSGLSRLARSNLSALLETWRTQWWERDLSNSSVERVAWRDLLHLVGYLTKSLQDWEFEFGWAPFNKTLNESPFHEYNRRLLEGDDPETIYREVQSRG